MSPIGLDRQHISLSIGFLIFY
ncbi:hypothetical protein F383_00796 [Gossypium arboreum]|uniref:Uncharacterized protein n=1 Tax=Gossypium arboreum TaxID=29729 RepID=A0A0B0NRG5_GOSAR|nr:hypothetical protein F383_00796 [Gossypium arboreum]